MAVPPKVQVDELEKCIETIIATVKNHPDALNEIERLRIETMLARLLTVVVEHEQKKQSKKAT